MDVLAGTHWTYKDKEYVVFAIGDERGELKVKDTNDSNWYDAVVYQSAEDHDNSGATDTNDEKTLVYIGGTLFIRRLDDFLAKFKPE